VYAGHSFEGTGETLSVCVCVCVCKEVRKYVDEFVSEHKKILFSVYDNTHDMQHNTSIAREWAYISAVTTVSNILWKRVSDWESSCDS
jgi:hypothetical protein